MGCGVIVSELLNDCLQPSCTAAFRGRDSWVFIPYLVVSEKSIVLSWAVLKWSVQSDR